jgi:hypothetical protein
MDPDQLYAQVVDTLPVADDPRRRACNVFPVRSYIANGKTMRTSSFSGVFVPAFAVHWGVVVEGYLFHLCFENPQDGKVEFNDFSRYGKPVYFEGRSLREGHRELSQGATVGNTRFNTVELTSIGKKLVDAFGSYHRLFWNCQVFADCYLRLITGERGFSE